MMAQFSDRTAALIPSIALICAVVAAPASAAPFVVSDATPATQVTHCAWYLDARPREVVAAPKDSTGKPYCKLDVGAVATGAHSIQAAFVVVDATWGEQEGPKSAPFAFSRPSAPSSAPITIRLEP